MTSLFTMAKWYDDIINGLFLLIDTMIYWIAALLYKVFIVVSEVNLFGNDNMQAIAERIWTMIGVAMLFVFAYNILTLIANPDNLSGKDEKSLSGLAKNLIISIVILTLLPTIFNYLYLAQSHIIRSNVIGNIILGGDNDNSDFSIEQAGTNATLDIFSAFFHPYFDAVNGDGKDGSEARPFSPNECRALINGEIANSKDYKETCTTYLAAYDEAKKTSMISKLTQNAFLKKRIATDWTGTQEITMEYLPIVSLIAGAFAGYLFLSFAIDVGVRVAKLSFLQLIAPIPVILRVTNPKGGTFSRWMKEISKTFLSVFIRLAFITFSMYIIKIVPDLLDNLWQNTMGADVGLMVRFITLVIVILGVLKFAKDGPKMLEDIFAMEHMDMNIKKKITENEYAMRGMSMAGSGFGSMTSNLWNTHKYNKENPKHKQSVLRSGIGGLFGGATKGWQNGNVKDFKQLGGGINQSIGEASAKRDRRDQFWHNNPTNTVESVANSLETKGKETYKNATDWLKGDSTNLKLQTAQNLTASFDTLTSSLDQLVGRGIDGLKQARAKAMENYNTGEPIKGIYEVQYGRITSNHIANPNDKQIRDYYKARITDKYKEAANRAPDTFKNYGDNICDQLERSIRNLGPEAQKRITKKLTEATKKSIDDLNYRQIRGIGDLREAFKEAVDGASSDDVKYAAIGAINEFAGAISDEVTLSSLEVTREKATKAQDGK